MTTNTVGLLNHTCNYSECHRDSSKRDHNQIVKIYAELQLVRPILSTQAAA